MEHKYTNITADSRKVQQGSIFVAVKGYSADGHDYIRTALDKGAACIVYEDEAKVSQLAAERPDIRFARCNVDACYPIAEHFGVSAIPTFLLFENGKETGRTAGYQSGENLLFSLGI